MKTKQLILITRELETGSPIIEWTNHHGVELLTYSFINTVAVPNLTITQTDWIFFSSPQGVKRYFERYALKAKKIAALSEGTARAVLNAGLEAHFIGDSAKLTSQIGADFFAQLGPQETVLFPISNISKRTIAAQNKDHRIVEVVIYKTEPIKKKLEKNPTLILFTSPSNVDGFLLGNRIEQATIIMAIGQTTGNHLKGLNYTNVHISESTDERKLLLQIQRLLKGREEGSN